MTQFELVIFFFVFPILCGLILGLILCKLKKSYLFTVVIIAICVIWQCILSNINLHGNEGPGIIFMLYTNAVSAFATFELIKIMVRKIGSRI